MDSESVFDAVTAGRVPAADRLRAARALVDGVFDEVQTMETDELITTFRACEELGMMADSLRVRFTGEADQRSAPALGEERLSAQLGCRTGNELLSRLVQAPWAEISKRRRLDTRTRPQVSLTGQPVPPKRPVIADALRAGRISMASADHIAYMLESTGNRARPDRAQVAEASLVGLATGTLTDNTEDESAVRAPDTEVDVAQDAPESPAPGGADAPGSPAAEADPGPALPPLLPSFWDLQKVTKEWHRALDPDGPEPKFKDAMKRRGLTLKAPVNGLVPLDGMLLPETAARLHRLFSAINNPAAANSNGDSHAQDVNLTPEGEPAPGDERTPSQRNHDAFTSILDVTARTTEIPTLGGDNATLVVHLDAKDLEDPHGTVNYDGISAPGSIETAHRLSCTAAIQKILFKDGEVIALGTKERTFNAHQRRAITARDGGCIIPSCDIPATWCELHHVIPWKEGGKTRIDNGVLLCWYHHHTIDTSGWKIRMIRGVPYVKAPTWLDPSGCYRAAPNYNTRPRGPGLPATTNFTAESRHGPDTRQEPDRDGSPHQSTSPPGGPSPDASPPNADPGDTTAPADEWPPTGTAPPW